MDLNDEEKSSPERLEQFLNRDDFQPPQIFAEMQEFISGRWVETARWVKFLELADIDGGRWSTPHVASFSGRTVTLLQKLLRNGACDLSADFSDMETMINKAAQQAVSTGNLQESDKEAFINTLLSKHIHFDEALRGPAEAFHKSAHVSSDQIGVRRLSTGLKLPEHWVNKKFAKKLDKNAEGAAVLVGAVEFLHHPVMIFMRSSSKTYLEQLTEVKVPLRYVCIILGPIQRLAIMRDVGRLWGAALSDDVFELVATNASSKADLLAGIANFAEHATMLAPGQWDPVERLPPPKHTVKKDQRKDVTNFDSFLDDELNSRLLDSPKQTPYKVQLPPGLHFTGKIFGGLIGDVKRKIPFYLSDYKDALTIQTLSTILYLSFIILAQMVSFGGLLGEATGNNIATLESIISASLNGILYHTLSAQPLNIISTTGPVLIFERLLYTFCGQWGFAFLEFRFWVGIWMAGIMTILVMFDLSFLVCFITRFTEDNFATLIASIFIYESISSVLKLYNQTPVKFHPNENITGNATLDCLCNWEPSALESYNEAKNTTGIESLNWKPISLGETNATGFVIPQCGVLNETICNDWNHCFTEGDHCNYVEPVPDVFLFSVLLFCFTFFIATSLKEFRHSIFLPSKVREIISDFAVTITVAGMVTVDLLCGLPTAKLLVPDKFQPTNPERGTFWLVNPFGQNPTWSIFMAAPMGILASILLFMDHQITTVIVNRKEHKLKKAFGYHLDLFILTLTIILGSVFGLTWLVAIGHVNSLRKESDSAAPGEPPKFLGLIEQRVTGIGIFLVIGSSILLRDVLKVRSVPTFDKNKFPTCCFYFL